jgi:hypothetical protein
MRLSFSVRPLWFRISEEPFMRDAPKRLRRLVREYSSIAYEAELRLVLQSLAEEFDRWRLGELSSSDLSDAIHQFHDGTSRDLWKSYNLGQPEWALARAVHSGAVDRSVLPPDLLDYLGGYFEFLEEESTEVSDGA